MKNVTIKALSEEQKHEILNAVQHLAEDIYSDFMSGLSATGEKPTNIGFIDGIVDMMYDNDWAGGPLMSKETHEIWKQIPYASRVRWVNKNKRYI